MTDQYDPAHVAWRRGTSGWLYPGVDVPPRAPAGRWTLRQRATALFAATLGLVFLYDVTAGSFAWISTMLGRDVMPRRMITWPPGAVGVVERSVWLMLLAGVVLVSLHCIGGRGLIGLDHRLTRRDHAAALGYYLRFACVGMLLSIGVFELLEVICPQLVTIAGGGSRPPMWLDLLTSVSAGWCEEIVATVLVLVLLERIPASRGRTFALTGIGTAIVITIHLSYHLHYGIRVLQLIVPVYVTVLCWRHARSLPALVFGHITYDVAITLVPRSSLMLLGLLFFFVGSYLDRKFWTDNSFMAEYTKRP